MQIINGTICFDAYDKNFIKKFGLIDAGNMVLDYAATHSTPFVYDMYQLCGYLGEMPKDIWYMVNNTEKMYQIYKIPKNSGGVRKLSSPNGRLKAVQIAILKRFLNRMPVSRYATAYVRGKKLIQNASPHTNKKYVLKMDISDFFGSINFEQVYNAVFNTTVYPKQIGVVLTTLCCFKDELPQGAPTSPAISNLVMKRFDDYIGNWCKQRDIAYTRYCDDMTFSSNKPMYHLYKKVKALLEDMGFETNEKKTRFIKCCARQFVTGLTVNDKVAVSKEYKRKLRQEIYYALKYGLAQSIMSGDKSNFVKNNTPDTTAYYHHLVGKINYVLQVEPDNQYFKQALHNLKATEVLIQI